VTQLIKQQTEKEAKANPAGRGEPPPIPNNAVDAKLPLVPITQCD
jgi:hypothetical protein